MNYNPFLDAGDFLAWERAPKVDQLLVSLTRWYTAIVFVWTGKWATLALRAGLLEFTGTHKNDRHTTWGVKLKYILVYNVADFVSQFTYMNIEHIYTVVELHQLASSSS